MIPVQKRYLLDLCTKTQLFISQRKNHRRTATAKLNILKYHDIVSIDKYLLNTLSIHDFREGAILYTCCEFMLNFYNVQETI